MTSLTSLDNLGRMGWMFRSEYSALEKEYKNLIPERYMGVLNSVVETDGYDESKGFECICRTGAGSTYAEIVVSFQVLEEEVLLSIDLEVRPIVSWARSRIDDSIYDSVKDLIKMSDRITPENYNRTINEHKTGELRERLDFYKDNIIPDIPLCNYSDIEGFLEEVSG